MALSVNPTRYIMTLSLSAGWPNESLVPRPEDIERELRAIFGVATSVQAARAVQNPSANVMRYYELRADPALTPAEIADALTVAIERIGATTLAGQEVQVALLSGEGAAVAQGTAKPLRI